MFKRLFEAIKHEKALHEGHLLKKKHKKIPNFLHQKIRDFFVRALKK